MNKIVSAMKYFYLGLQFIFVVILPIFLGIFLAGYIKDKYGLGDWVTLVGVIVGLIFMVADAYSFGRFVLKQLEKDGKKKDGK